MKKMISKNTKVVKSASTDFWCGAMYPFKAFGFFISHPKYWLYMIIPVLISVIIYSLLFSAMIGWLMPFLVGLMPKAGDWYPFLIYLYEGFLWLLRIVFFLVSCVVILFTFTLAYSLVACPFLDMMSIKLEADRYGFKFDDGGWKQMGKDILMSVKNNIWLNCVAIFWMLLFFPANFLIPFVGFIPGFAFASYFFGLSFLIYSAEHRRIHRRDFSKVFKSKRWIILGFGVIVYAILPIPFLAIVFLPIAVLGGTMLYNEQFANDVETHTNNKLNEA